MNFISDMFFRYGYRRAISLILVITLLTFITGCGGSAKKEKKDAKGGGPADIPPEAKPGVPQLTFGSKDIALRIQADSMLNLFDGKAHTVVMGVYQVDDPNAFKGLAKDQKGLKTLLECKSFGSSCLSVQRVILQPGELQNLVLDRAKGAQWVCLAVGYYNLDPGNCTRMYQIPMNEIKKGLLFKKKYLLPGRLYVKLMLDPHGIRSDSGPSEAPPPTGDTKPAPGQAVDSASSAAAPAAAPPPASAAAPAAAAGEQAAGQAVDDGTKQIEQAAVQGAKTEAEESGENYLKKIIKN